jgi:hypothetical protein
VSRRDDALDARRDVGELLRRLTAEARFSMADLADERRRAIALGPI